MVGARHSQKAPTRDYWLSQCVQILTFHTDLDTAIAKVRQTADQRRFNREQRAKLETAIAQVIELRAAA